MANLKTDSPLSRRIVRSFIDFLNSVEPAPGVDLEGLEVTKDCLADVFKIDPLIYSSSKPDSLVDIFSSRECIEHCETKLDSSHDRFSADAASTSSAPNMADANHAATSQFQYNNQLSSKSLTDLDINPGNPTNNNEMSKLYSQDGQRYDPHFILKIMVYDNMTIEMIKDKDWTREAHEQGISKDELFGQFFEVLEKVHYFKNMPDGNDDQFQLDRATRIFHNAIEEMEKSGCQTYDRKNLAEILKSQGNKAMQLKLYSDAIELYSFAIALSGDNAVFYCNRAAAYTQVSQYAEAIRDCLKSIEIDPNYGKAYSRLGFAYYAQGNYRDAIDKGFMKALQLDPNNDSVKENIRVAEQKLNEEYRRTHHNQNSSSSGQHRDSNQQSAGGSRSHGLPPQFNSMPFTANGIPVDISSMIRNITANMYQVPHSQDESQVVGNSDEPFPEPEIRIGGSINVNLGDQIPEELSGAFRSVMEMFSGAAPHDNSQENLNERSGPS